MALQTLILAIVGAVSIVLSPLEFETALQNTKIGPLRCFLVSYTIVNYESMN